MPRPRKRHWEGRTVEHRGFVIRLKRDFDLDNPPFVDGMPVTSGYEVIYKTGSREGQNAMPDNTWFQSVKAARHGIDVLIDVGGEENAPQFWALLRQETACRHLRYVAGPSITTAQGAFKTHVCTQCGDWRTETNALSSWMPAATLAVEASVPHAVDGSHEVRMLTHEPSVH